MKKLTLFLVVVLLLGTIQTAFALPVITSTDNQTYKVNDYALPIRDIIITDDTQNPKITAEYGIKIKIPDNLKVLYHSYRTAQEITLSGPAVDNGKVDAKPKVTFDTKEKVMTIPVTEDFSASESVTISKIALEGFNESTAANEYLELIYSATEPAIKDIKYFYIETSTQSDNEAPDELTNISIEQSSNTSITIGWTDPNDLDINHIQILRGIDPLPIGGTEYKTIGKGVQKFTDTGLKVGDTVRYLLRASDGVNLGPQSVELAVTLKDLTATTIDSSSTKDSSGTTDSAVTVDSSSTKDSSGTTDSTATADSSATGTATIGITAIPETTTKEVPLTFSDTETHWAKDQISAMAKRKVIFGYPDGKFKPDGSLNRAEAAAILYRVFNSEDPAKPLDAPFTDIKTEDWFAPYVSKLKELGLVNGKTPSTYAPAENINRAEFLTLAMNVYDFVNKIDDTSAYMTLQFADLDATAWYAETVSRGFTLGFINGSKCDKGTCFNATSQITRAEATKTLFRMFEKTIE